MLGLRLRQALFVGLVAVAAVVGLLLGSHALAHRATLAHLAVAFIAGVVFTLGIPRGALGRGVGAAAFGVIAALLFFVLERDAPGARDVAGIARVSLYGVVVSASLVLGMRVARIDDEPDAPHGRSVVDE